MKPGKWHLYYVLDVPKDVKYKSYSYDQVNITDAYYEFEYHEQGGVYVLILQGAYVRFTKLFNKKCVVGQIRQRYQEQIMG